MATAIRHIDLLYAIGLSPMPPTADSGTTPAGRSAPAPASSTAFTVKTWMVAVILFLAAQLGASLWWGATLTANQSNLSEKVDGLSAKVEAGAGARYSTEDARIDKALVLELHGNQDEKLQALEGRLNEMSARIGRLGRQ